MYKCKYQFNFNFRWSIGFFFFQYILHVRMETINYQTICGLIIIDHFILTNIINFSTTKSDSIRIQYPIAIQRNWKVQIYHSHAKKDLRPCFVIVSSVFFNMVSYDTIQCNLYVLNTCTWRQSKGYPYSQNLYIGP